MRRASHRRGRRKPHRYRIQATEYGLKLSEELKRLKNDSACSLGEREFRIPNSDRALARAWSCGHTSSMSLDDTQRALADITAETDPTVKHLKLASPVTAVFHEAGIELVVGGSAIESYTEGA